MLSLLCFPDHSCLFLMAFASFYQCISALPEDDAPETECYRMEFSSEALRWTSSLCFFALAVVVGAFGMQVQHTVHRTYSASSSNSISPSRDNELERGYYANLPPLRTPTLDEFVCAGGPALFASCGVYVLPLTRGDKEARRRLEY